MARLIRYEDQTLQNAYENACDCQVFGTGPKQWEDCGISPDMRKEVWAVAWYDMGNGFNDTAIKSIPEIMAEVYGMKGEPHGEE